MTTGVIYECVRMFLTTRYGDGMAMQLNDSKMKSQGGIAQEAGTEAR